MFNSTPQPQEIDFTAIGATDLKTLDVSAALLHEKLSLLILSDHLCNPSFNTHFQYTEYQHPFSKTGCLSIHDETPPYFTVQHSSKKYAIDMNDFLSFTFQEVADDFPKMSLYSSPPKCITIKPGADFRNISLYDAVRTKQNVPDADRIDELLSYFQQEHNPYTPFMLRSNRFRTDQFEYVLKDMPQVKKDDFIDFQKKLCYFVSAGFPRSFGVFQLEEQRDQYNRVMNYKQVLVDNGNFFLPAPVFYKPIGSMAYDLFDYQKLPKLRLQRFFHNPDGCGLRQALIPSICLQVNSGGTNWHFLNAMSWLPEMKKTPLFNINKVASKNTDTIVICGCIEDADALQRANAKNEHVAFTAFFPNHMEQTECTRLNGKNVIILISNHSGRSMDDEYEHANSIYEFLKSRNVATISFVCRQVKYPDSSCIATLEDIASAYYHNPPEVVKSIKKMDEAEFCVMLDKIREMNHAKNMLWEEQGIANTESSEETHDNFLVRGFLYRGAITELCSKAGVGKSNFALGCGRFLVGGKTHFLEDRFWTLPKTNEQKKVVYWGYSDVSKDDINNLKKIYKSGLSKDADANFFIELVPEIIQNLAGELDMKIYKNEIKKYAYRGTPGRDPDLLIIDHLSDVAGKDNVYEALDFLSKLKQYFPKMAILVLHHLADPGNIRKGSEAKMKPRVVLIMERIRSDSLKRSYSESTGFIWKLRYSKQNVSLSDVETDFPFYIASDTQGGYSVFSPSCSKKDFGKLIVYYYRNKSLLKRTNKEIGTLMGYSESSIEKTFSSSSQEIDCIYQEILQKNKEQEEKDKVLTNDKLKKQKKSSFRLPKKTVNDIETDDLAVIDDAQEIEELENTED